MNREKKEEIRKYKEARKGLTTEEIAELDRKEAIDAKISELAMNCTAKCFPRNMMKCMTALPMRVTGFGESIP